MLENTYNLPTWEHPSNYGGFSPDGDYLVYSRNRDSSILENSNYEIILSELKEAESNLENNTDKPFVYDFRANHWGCGWVEYILISKNSPDSLQALVAEIIGALQDYPIYSESDYSEKQYEAICEYWENMSISERVDYCSDNGESIFAARHNSIPEEVFDKLNEEIY